MLPLDTPPAPVDATGTRRRISALVALGYPLPTLAAQLRRRTDSLTRTLTAHHVTTATARAVDDLYDQLSGTPAPDSSATRNAREFPRKHSWAPPLAWDDIDTDPAPNPTSTEYQVADRLDELVVERAVAGQLT